jgi:hypothetical protein
MTEVSRETGGLRVKRGLADMLKGGVIMDVTTAEQAKIAEDEKLLIEQHCVRGSHSANSANLVDRRRLCHFSIPY